MKPMMWLAQCSTVIALLAVFSSGQNLKPDEIIAKHLEAIGPKEKREGMKTLMAIGLSEFESRIPSIKGGGRAVVVSDPSNLFWVISLNSKEYPFERIGYFGDKISLPFIASGTRSLLGLFISEHNKVLSEGLFGGTMSLRWPLLDADVNKAMMKSGGTKKIDGRTMHVLDYFPPSGSSELTIKLFFDSETFQHVRSVYRREIRPGSVQFGAANQTASGVIILIEDFSDFKTVDGLIYPHTYRVSFTSNSNNSMNENIWGIKVAEYRLNQKLTPDFFTFETK